MERCLCGECHTHLDLGFAEFASALQTAEGGEDLGVEVGGHGDLVVRDAISNPCRQGRIDEIVDHRRRVDDQVLSQSRVRPWPNAQRRSPWRG